MLLAVRPQGGVEATLFDDTNRTDSFTKQFIKYPEMPDFWYLSARNGHALCMDTTSGWMAFTRLGLFAPFKRVCSRLFCCFLLLAVSAASLSCASMLSFSTIWTPVASGCSLKK